MFEFTRVSRQEKALHDELIGAFFAGVISKPISQRLGLRDSEEGVICTMFQSLGKLLATYFLYGGQPAGSVVDRIGSVGGSRVEQGARHFLSRPGRGRRRGTWHFPDRLIEVMQRTNDREVARPKTEVEKLRVAANLANELFATALRSSAAEKTSVLQALVQTLHAPRSKSKRRDLSAAVEQGLAGAGRSVPRRSTCRLRTVRCLNAIRLRTGGSSSSARARPSPLSLDDTLIPRRKGARCARERRGCAAVPVRRHSRRDRDAHRGLPAQGRAAHGCWRRCIAAWASRAR